MKTRRAVLIRRRFRFAMGWALILSVAVGEFWVLANFMGGLNQMSAAAQQHHVPPMAEWVIAIR